MHLLLVSLVHSIPPRVIQQASVRNTRLAHAVERSVVVMQALHQHHIAKKSSLHLSRNSTDIITLPLSLFPFMHSLSTLCITNYFAAWRLVV